MGLVIVGKKTQEEIQSMREELLVKDKQDHSWFEKFKVCMLALCSAAWGGALYLFLATLWAALTNNRIKWVFADHWPYMLLTIIVVFTGLYLWLRQPYKFNDDADSLPKTYRYFHLTNNKNVLREEISAIKTKSGSWLDLDVVSLDNNGEEEYAYVGMFPIMFKRDISETVIDLEKEMAYVPYNNNDIDTQYADDDE